MAVYQRRGRKQKRMFKQNSVKKGRLVRLRISTEGSNQKTFILLCKPPYVLASPLLARLLWQWIIQDLITQCCLGDSPFLCQWVWAVSVHLSQTGYWEFTPITYHFYISHSGCFGQTASLQMELCQHDSEKWHYLYPVLTVTRRNNIFFTQCWHSGILPNPWKASKSAHFFCPLKTNTVIPEQSAVDKNIFFPPSKIPLYMQNKHWIQI